MGLAVGIGSPFPPGTRSCISDLVDLLELEVLETVAGVAEGPDLRCGWAVQKDEAVEGYN